MDAVVEPGEGPQPAPGKPAPVTASALVAPSGARFVFLPNLRRRTAAGDEPSPGDGAAPPGGCRTSVTSTSPPRRARHARAEQRRDRAARHDDRRAASPSSPMTRSGAELYRGGPGTAQQRLPNGDVKLIMTSRSRDRKPRQVEASPRGDAKTAGVVSPVKAREKFVGEVLQRPGGASPERVAHWRRTGDDGLSIAVLQRGRHPPRPRLRRRGTSSRPGHGGNFDRDGRVEIGWDWVSADGAKILLHKQRPVYRIMADGSVTSWIEERSRAS